MANMRQKRRMQDIRQAIKRKSSDRQAFGNDNISRNKNCVNTFCIIGQNLKVFKEVRYTLTARRLKTDIAKAKRS